MHEMQRGLDERHEQDQLRIIRDTRTVGQRIYDFFSNPRAVAATILLMGAGAFFVPGFADICLLLGCLFALTTMSRKLSLPFRLPKRAAMKDWSDPLPGTKKPGPAAGIYFFGNRIRDNEELWFNNIDMRTHVLIFGSTGSGKTEGLVSLAYNALLQGSGFIYVDGKGDNSLYAKVFSMVRSMGREDDLLLINFMTGAKDIIGPQKHRLSNTLNPFARGSSSMISQMVVSLMDSASKSSDGDMWKGRAIAFVESLMKILVAMRDAGHILLDANTVRNYFHLPRLEAIVLDKVFPRDDQEAISLEGMPDVVLEPIKNYLFTLPGFNREKKGKQVSQVWEQHGFITMQLVRVFSSLADTYGHILRTKLAEVDLHDVVLNRRILVVLLPALEKSPDELSNLGKVIIATLKSMMASGLGEAVEGEYRDLIQRKITNSPTPYLCILDEYGYYAVQGFAVVPAQARSLGFSVVFAGQDLPAFQKASKEEAASIGANTNIKMCMKLEDPTETWEFFQKTAGESYVTHTSGFQTDTRSVSNNYRDTQSAQLEKRMRVDLQDLKRQREGEATFFFRGKIVRGRLFYANPAPVKRMRLNQLLKVDGPTDQWLHQVSKGMKWFEEHGKELSAFTFDAPAANSEIEHIIAKMNEDRKQTPIDRGVAALLAFHERDKPSIPEHEELAELAEKELNIFMSLRTSEYLLEVLLSDNPEEFSKPLLDHAFVQRCLQNIGRFQGLPEEKTVEIANEIVRDMQFATHYPPDDVVVPPVSEIVADVMQLVENIKIKKQTSTENQDNE